MLVAKTGFTLVTREMIKEEENKLIIIQADRPNVGIVYKSDELPAGTKIRYIPHSELPIEVNGTQYYAVPTTDIVCFITNDPSGE